MNTKVVNSYIKNRVWSCLKEWGFSEFTSRLAWNYFDEDFIHVVNFQSFSSYNADVINCTTFSFVLNLGIFNRTILTDGEIKSKNNVLKPNEYECHFRYRMTRTIPQDYDETFKDSKTKYNDIWYIDPKGKELDRVFDAVLNEIKNVAIPWFKKYSSHKKMFDIATLKERSGDNTSGYGNPDVESPISMLYSACLAKKIGLPSVSLNYFKRLLETDCFSGLEKKIKKQIEDVNLLSP
ncbi:MAG: hypothetical protein COB02_03215 [Candidatus Cloacimonadota bacterium]|nr:MAG: hypothetical protein COB02_03215 [Candidatus Cloacimonadota bacterium]